MIILIKRLARVNIVSYFTISPIKLHSEKSSRHVTGNSISALFSWTFLQRPNVEKIKPGRAAVWVRPALVKSLLPSCFTQDYFCSAFWIGRKLWVVLLFYSIVLSMFAFWCFPDLIVSSLNSKRFSSHPSLYNHFSGRYVSEEEVAHELKWYFEILPDVTYGWT